MRNLRSLEQDDMVNSKNDYQEIINAIAKVRGSWNWGMEIGKVIGQDREWRLGRWGGEKNREDGLG